MLSSEKIKILIIDDSVLIRKYVSRLLSELENMEVIATAPNGSIGMQKAILYKPDIVVLDIEMPEMNGLQFLKSLKTSPEIVVKPIIIMFSSLVGDSSVETFEALANGAADFIKKPEGQVNDNIDYLKKEFDIKIKALIQSKKEKQNNHDSCINQLKDFANNVIEEPAVLSPRTVTGLQNIQLISAAKNIRPELIAIGSSTGGPNAIRKILENLDNFTIPIVIAQHMPAGFTLEFAKNLSNIFQRKIKELSDGEQLEDGVIYICPGGSHSRIMRSSKGLYFKMDTNTYDGFFFKPSIDIFFRSINESVGRNVVGIILTGMGKDGSIESVNLRKSGAIIIAQSKDSSVVWGMPGSSYKNGGVDILLDINEIGPALNKIIIK